jgi:predicted signal transduction protein with EAL and GGDEF domain
VQYILRASNAFNSLKRQEDRLRYLAYFDPLTNLPNRRSFNEQLNRILKRAQRHDKLAALLFIDLDNFKRINDSIGHGRGDRLLVEISKRLTNELREDDAISYFSDYNAEDEQKTGTEIARLGGDEFTVVLDDVDTPEDVERIARRIMHTLSEPIPLHTHNPVVTPSIGIAIYPQDGSDADSLLRNADTAMYAAKSDGRSCFRFYNEEMNARSVEQLKLEEDLREGLRTNQLELRYQPQVETSSGRVVSFEALVRWKHPERGMVSPADFIPVAERTGQIIELGEWVLNEVSRPLRLLGGSRHSPLPGLRQHISPAVQSAGPGPLYHGVPRALRSGPDTSGAGADRERDHDRRRCEHREADAVEGARTGARRR